MIAPQLAPLVSSFLHEHEEIFIEVFVIRTHGLTFDRIVGCEEPAAAGLLRF